MLPWLMERGEVPVAEVADRFDMSTDEVARELANRLVAIFRRDARGRRPVYGGAEKFQTDPHWRDHLLFYEYFHGDLGAGVGASHQTGWTGVVAPLIQVFGNWSAEQILEGTAFRQLPGQT